MQWCHTIDFLTQSIAVPALLRCFLLLFALLLCSHRLHSFSSHRPDNAYFIQFFFLDCFFFLCFSQPFYSSRSAAHDEAVNGRERYREICMFISWHGHEHGSERWRTRESEQTADCGPSVANAMGHAKTDNLIKRQLTTAIVPTLAFHGTVQNGRKPKFLFSYNYQPNAINYVMECVLVIVR